MEQKQKKRKFNVIDMLVVLVIIAALCVVGVSVIASRNDKNVKDMRITFYAEEVPASIAENIAVGDLVADGNINSVAFGKAVDVTVEDSVSYVSTPDNTFIRTSRPGYRSVTVVCETSGIYSDIGAVYDDYIYGVGHTLMMFVGDVRFSARVRDIEIVEG